MITGTMPPEILNLMDKPLSLIAVLFVGGLAGIMVEQSGKAGIGYHEVVAGHTTLKDLRALVDKLVPVGTDRT